MNLKKLLSENTVLISILSLSAALMAWGITWGLPLRKGHIDEAVVVFYTMRFFTGDLNPHVFFDYPTLYLYLLGALYSIFFLIGKLFGLFSSLDQFAGVYLHGDASAFYVIGRALSLFFGTGSVYLVYRIGKENFKNGLLPALLMALIPINNLFAHYAMVDTAAVFFLLLAFFFFARSFNTDRPYALYLGSFILGLGTAAKYYPAVFFIPVFIYYAFRKDFRIIPASGLLLAGFIAGCPYALLDFHAFSSRFIDRFQYIIWGNSGTLSAVFGHGANGAGQFTKLSLVLKAFANTFSPPLFLALTAGCVIFCYRQRVSRYLLLWAAPSAVYLLFVFSWNVISPHYLMPVIPFMILAGLYGIDKINTAGRVKTIVILVLCLLPAYQTIRTDHILAKEDTRITAYKWMKMNISPGARILRFANTPEFSNTDPYGVLVDWEDRYTLLPDKTIASSFDYVITSRFGAVNGELSEFERSLMKYYTVKNEWGAVPLASFHHPRILLFEKKQGKTK